jgi:hypothetical protein
MGTIEAYIAKQNKIIQEDRDRTLIRLGIVEKEYSPDGSKSRKYDKIDYVGGEQKYYREVPIQVSDEEYALILEKAEQVEAIRRKEEIEKEREQARRRTSYALTKRWLPIFEKPKSEWASEEDKSKPETGKSKIATACRVFAWLSCICLVIFGIAIAVTIKSFNLFLLRFGIAGMTLLIQYAIAEILDCLVELTAIARNGFKYSETNKK